MSTPTATTLPEVCGATSVCWSPARLPVASKKRGRSRLIAAAVVTSTAVDSAPAAGASFLTLAFDQPHDATKALTATSTRIRATNLNFTRDRMSLTIRCLRSNSIQKNVREILRRVLVRDVQQAAFRVPKIVVERVVHHHADETTNHDRGIHFDQGALALTLVNIAAEKFINSTNKLVEEHLRKLVLVEGGVEQQPLKVRVLFVVVECSESERLKDGPIVFALDGVGSHFLRLKLIARTRF